MYLGLGCCRRHEFTFSPFCPLIHCHNVGTNTFFPSAVKDGVLTVLVLPAVPLVIHPVRCLTVVLGAVTGIRFLAQSFRDTVTNILTFLRFLYKLTNTPLAPTGPTKGPVTVVILAVSSSVTLPGTQVTLTVTLLLLAFVHPPTVLTLVTLHRFTHTEASLAGTVPWVCAAGTVRVLTTLTPPEEWVPSNDALPEVTHTGGVLDILAQAVLLTVLGETTGTYVRGGGGAGGQEEEGEEGEWEGRHPETEGSRTESQNAVFC